MTDESTRNTDTGDLLMYAALILTQDQMEYTFSSVIV